MHFFITDIKRITKTPYHFHIEYRKLVLRREGFDVFHFRENEAKIPLDAVK